MSSGSVVDISIKDMGNWSTECLTIIEHGFNTRFKDGGFVQMEVRKATESEGGKEVFIAFYDDLFDFSGDYLPMSLEKEQVKTLIDYLQKCHDEIK